MAISDYVRAGLLWGPTIVTAPSGRHAQRHGGADARTATEEKSRPPARFIGIDIPEPTRRITPERQPQPWVRASRHRRLSRTGDTADHRTLGTRISRWTRSELAGRPVAGPPFACQARRESGSRSVPARCVPGPACVRPPQRQRSTLPRAPRSRAHYNSGGSTRRRRPGCRRRTPPAPPDAPAGPGRRSPRERRGSAGRGPSTPRPAGTRRERRSRRRTRTAAAPTARPARRPPGSAPAPGSRR